jgi:hypothetical protein
LAGVQCIVLNHLKRGSFGIFRQWGLGAWLSSFLGGFEVKRHRAAARNLKPLSDGVHGFITCGAL